MNMIYARASNTYSYRPNKLLYREHFVARNHRRSKKIQLQIGSIEKIICVHDLNNYAGLDKNLILYFNKNLEKFKSRKPRKHRLINWWLNFLTMC